MVRSEPGEIIARFINQVLTLSTYPVGMKIKTTLESLFSNVREEFSIKKDN